MRNVSSVTIAEDAGGRQERVTIRGFVTDTTFQDGFRNGPTSNATFPDFSNVERVNILKGPSSTVFGRLDPGGVVHLVTKQPLSEHYYSLTMQGGSYQLLRPTIDASGPLTANKALLYRFIASGQDRQSFRDFNYTRRLFLSPTLTWTPSPSRSFRLYTEFVGGSNLNDRGLIAIGTRPANLPLSRYLADPSLSYPYRQGKAGLSYVQAIPTPQKKTPFSAPSLSPSLGGFWRPDSSSIPHSIESRERPPSTRSIKPTSLRPIPTIPASRSSLVSSAAAASSLMRRLT